jgi:hypothetical protein
MAKTSEKQRQLMKNKTPPLAKRVSVTAQTPLGS